MPAAVDERVKGDLLSIRRPLGPELVGGGPGESLRLAAAKTPVFAALPVGKFPPGDYRLKLTLRAGKKELAKEEAEFKMNWNWEAALTYNFKDVVDLLRYFSRETDVEPLEKAPPEKRLEAWEQFWKDRDPTQATRENEAKKEFERLSKRIYRLLGLSGYARIDYRVTESGRIYALEVNPNPQIAHNEDFADSAEHCSVKYKALLQKIMTLGMSYDPICRW